MNIRRKRDPNSRTSISLKTNTMDRLRELGTMADTYDTVIIKLIEHFKESKK